MCCCSSRSWRPRQDRPPLGPRSSDARVWLAGSLLGAPDVPACERAGTAAVRLWSIPETSTGEESVGATFCVETTFSLVDSCNVSARLERASAMIELEAGAPSCAVDCSIICRAANDSTGRTIQRRAVLGTLSEIGGFQYPLILTTRCAGSGLQVSGSSSYLLQHNRGRSK